MKKLTLLLLAMAIGISCSDARQKPAERYRILISTDIGGTDPDDNQSMAHLLMYWECKYNCVVSVLYFSSFIVG